MSSRSPSWTELLGRMAAVSFRTATGTVTYREIGSARGDVQAGSADFWYRRGGSLRVEDAEGLRLLEADGDTFLRTSQGIQLWSNQVMMGGLPGDPKQLLGGPDMVSGLSSSNDYSQPQGPARRTEIDGRLGWWFVLSPPPHKKLPLEIVIDDATGAILELRSVGIENFTTLTNFAPDAVIADERFVYDGPVQTDLADKRRRQEEDRRLAQEVDWPTPRYWPTGLPIELLEADPEVGSFIGHLEGIDDYPLLARWLKDERAPKRFAERSKGQHVHSWSDDKWEWVLVVSKPLDPTELERVIASIPTDG